MQQAQDLTILNIFRECSEFAKKNGAINLAQGVPEANMDRIINQLLPESFNTGWQYVDSHGVEPLRDAIGRVLFTQHFNAHEVLITSGCSESLYLSYFVASQSHGNKIAFLEPFFPNFIGLPSLFNLEAVPVMMVTAAQKMLPDWDAVEAAFKSDVKIFILNTPHNPSGFVMTKDDSTHLRNLVDKYGVFLIIDYAYQYHIYDAAISEHLEILYTNNEKVLIAGSASKLLSATGIRIGWLVGNPNLLEIAHTLHLYLSYSQPAPLQYLTAQLIEKCDQEWQSNLQNLYRHKRDTLLAALNATPLRYFVPDGGYFVLADYSALDNNAPSGEFVKQFAQKIGVMTIPVEPFYYNKQVQQIRFSFSVQLEAIKAAAVKLQSLCV